MNTNQGEGVSVRGRRTWLARWVSDLGLGVRLAIGGGRASKTGIARLVLGTIGVGIAVGVLLLSASVGPMFVATRDREAAQFAHLEPVPGVDPLYLRHVTTEFRDVVIGGEYVRPAGPRAPLPPGVDRLPGDGEILVSPALAELLEGPDGELLRPRFPERVVGVIDQSGVTDGGSLSFYAGDDEIGPDTGRSAYGFGGGSATEMPPNMIILITIGTVVLLVPVLVFVATSTRIAGAERDRRLAALRLVGADARQARRIAAAESLVSAVTGLAFGVGLFLAFRAMLGNFAVLGVRPYPSDVAPAWPLVMLIVLLVPGLALLTAQVALRRTIIEPLGVVRKGRPVRRRLWWRLVPVVLGPALLLSQVGRYRGAADWIPVVVAGSALLLIGIPALLPWLLERAVARIRGGPPAVQLAVRRLQLDSGTAARVVGGVAVVLAGAIALEAVLAAQTERYRLPDLPAAVDEFPLFMNFDAELPEEVADQVRAVPGVSTVLMARQVLARTTTGEEYGLAVVDCAALRRYTDATRCADGDVFRMSSRGWAPAPGQTLTMLGSQAGTGDAVRGGTWTVPDRIEEARLSGSLYLSASLLVTPGAVAGVRLPSVDTTLAVATDPDRPDVLEHVRNAVAPHTWHVDVFTVISRAYESTTVETFLTVRGALLGGALFTLLLAGVSMLVLALEQVRERRRPLAALAATGVPTGTLARSLLWQNTVPVLFAVAVAVLTGVGLAALVFRLLEDPFSMQWPVVALFSGIAAALVVLVTALTLPTLRSATRLAALRSE